MPAFSRSGLRWISSDAIDFDLTMRLHAVLLREIEDVVADLGGIVGAEDLGAARFDVAR